MPIEPTRPAIATASAGFAESPALDEMVSEQRLANDGLRLRGRKMPRPGTIAPATLRKARLYREDGSMRPTLCASAQDAMLDTAQGRTLTRIFDNSLTAGTIVHFHGGGWALGSVYEQDEMLSRLCRDASAKCISVDYPLAPESTLLDTVEHAAAALAAIIEAHGDGPVVIVGESAGAHVALQALLHLRARPDLLARVAALSLSYGIYDLSMTPSQRAWGREFLGLSTDWLEWFYTLALPGHDREARSVPSISPLYADLSGLPVTLISIGTLDPLLDDSLFLAARLKAAGVEARLRIYPEAPHGFNHMETAMAAYCNAQIAAFAAEMMLGAGSCRPGA